MKAKELIELLKKMNPEKEVMIQQGGEHDYMAVHGAKEMKVWDEDGDGDELEDETGEKNIIGIDFQQQKSIEANGLQLNEVAD